ncbi:MAG TPA: hypothetical protein VLC46_05570 [Thermoanaerobaculia bacterium]|jgi:hypothetical protein|nr:hypothetical protein [Thermoanaerobaculia bacterium]
MSGSKSFLSLIVLFLSIPASAQVVVRLENQSDPEIRVELTAAISRNLKNIPDVSVVSDGAKLDIVLVGFRVHSQRPSQTLPDIGPEPTKYGQLGRYTDEWLQWHQLDTLRREEAIKNASARLPDLFAVSYCVVDWQRHVSAGNIVVGPDLERVASSLVGSMDAQVFQFVRQLEKH